MLSVTPRDQLVAISYAIRDGSKNFSLYAQLDSWTVGANQEPFSKPIVEPIFGSILQSLADFELAFQATLAPRCQIYLLGFGVLHDLISLQNEQFSETDIRTASSVLHSIGLIYRLPSAVKFRYPPIQMPQVRISAWGLLAAQELLSISPVSPSTRQKKLNEQLHEHEQCYRVLITACSSSERPLDTETIHTLNANVPIPIVT